MRYFGTDGIRGVIDEGLDSNLAYKLGLAVGKNIIEKGYSKKVLIGKDTRVSNDLITNSVACGLMDMGIDCLMLGIVPTACVSFLTSRLDVGFGIMVTASHNTWNMNGIKLMNRFGFKCSFDEEEIIEKNIDKAVVIKSSYKGRIIECIEYIRMYEDYVVNTINIDLQGLNIALDMANGSNYELAPKIFKRLGANIVCIGNSSDGRVINKDCGAQNIDALCKEVTSHKCDYGFAFDGDADRLRVVLSDGTILDGDDILYVFANYFKEMNRLNSMTIVGTIMSNSGLELTLEKHGIKLVRVDVGDKNVIEKMNSCHYSVGGEPSGHIALLDYNTTCDALFNALYMLKIVLVDRIDIFKYLSQLIKLPSLEANISVSKEFRERYKEKSFAKNIEKTVDEYRENARIIVRPSGTEAVFRISIESMSEDKNTYIRNSIVKIISDLDNKIHC